MEKCKKWNNTILILQLLSEEEKEFCSVSSLVVRAKLSRPGEFKRANENSFTLWCMVKTRPNFFAATTVLFLFTATQLVVYLEVILFLSCELYLGNAMFLECWVLCVALKPLGTLQVKGHKD